MKIDLFNPLGFSLSALDEFWRDHGVRLSIRTPGEPLPGRKGRAKKAVLLFPRQDLITLGETIASIRAELPDQTPLWVCAPQFPPEEMEALASCGADKIFTPGQWLPAAAVDRILAELILAGDLGPVGLGQIRGASSAMRAIYRNIEVVAPLDEPVLILGETGSGKEVVAHEIHRLSGRKRLMILNCAALTPNLLESELFGHERGAFSGAVSNRKGLLVEAGEGTVFLDEIGDLALPSQAKLLRVLEEKKVRPVGSDRWLPIGARLILATNRNLVRAYEQGNFRQDLYERICTFVLELPPLRKRLADILLLARHFVETYNRQYPGRRTLPDGGLDSLFRHHWPGNVRELRRVVYRAAAFAAGPEGPISTRQLLEATTRGQLRQPAQQHFEFDPAGETWPQVQDRMKRLYFRKVMAQSDDNKAIAAEKAGLSRSQFYAILKDLDAGTGS